MPLPLAASRATASSFLQFMQPGPRTFTVNMVFSPYRREEKSNRQVVWLAGVTRPCSQLTVSASAATKPSVPSTRNQRFVPSTHAP